MLPPMLLTIGLLIALGQSPANADRLLYLVLLKTGQALPAEKAPDIQKGHFAHLERLGSEGVGLAAGPVSGWAGVQGVVVMAASSATEAFAMAARDPAVQGGYIVPEVVEFRSSAQFGKPPRPISMERLVIGFLSDGAAGPSALPAETFIASAQHAFRDRLVLIGALTAERGRRIIYVMRAQDVNAANELWRGHPLVRAHGLQTESYDWYLPAGVMP